MKRLLAVILILSAVWLAGGCATGPGVTNTTGDNMQWEETAKAGHRIVGLTIKTAQALLPVAQPYITEDDYVTYSVLINTTEPAVHSAVGVALETVISVTDAAQKADALAAYEAAVEKLTPLMTEVTTAISAIQAAQKSRETK